MNDIKDFIELNKQCEDLRKSLEKLQFALDPEKLIEAFKDPKKRYLLEK
jgi:hypothetical protein